jgi:hypothetical protein
MSGEKLVQVEVVGNAYKLQLMASDPVVGGVPYPHGKPVVILDTAPDETIGKAVRDLFRTRIQTARTKKAAEVGA